MRRRTLLYTVCLTLACTWIATPTATALALHLKARSAIVMDLTSGRVLFEQNPDAHIAPASLTKVLTMYLVFDGIVAGKARLADKVRVSGLAAEASGSSMRLEAGERVELYELMKGMAVASGNDACIAVAQHVAPDVETFVKRMNRKAKALGMRDSHFVNPNGLPAKGQTTTARDMLTLAANYLQHYPDALKIHSLTSITHNDSTRRNSNRLLGEVDGVDGLKTGYVDASGYNIIVTAKRGGHRIVAVVMGGASAKARNREAKRIIEACFAKLGAPTPILAARPDKRDNQPQPQAKVRPNPRDLLSAATREFMDKTAAPESKATDPASQRTLLYASSGPSVRGAVTSAKSAPQDPADPEQEAAPSAYQSEADAAGQVGSAAEDKAVAALAANILSARQAIPNTAPETSRNGRAAVSAAKQRSSVYALSESTWKSRDKATERVASLRRQGIQAYATHTVSGKAAGYRVLIGHYDSARAAEASKRTLAQRYNLKLAVVGDGGVGG